MEKISFLYVSQILPGKMVRTLNYPQPWVKPDELPGKISLDVSFGLIIKTKINYRVDIEISHKDQRIGSDSNQSMQSEPIVAKTTSGNESVSIENMSLLNVNVKDEGIYKVKISLHSVDDQQEKSIMIHSSECFFYLAKEWNI